MLGVQLRVGQTMHKYLEFKLKKFGVPHTPYLGTPPFLQGLPWHTTSTSGHSMTPLSVPGTCFCCPFSPRIHTVVFSVPFCSLLVTCAATHLTGFATGSIMGASIRSSSDTHVILRQFLLFLDAGASSIMLFTHLLQ